MSATNSRAVWQTKTKRRASVAIILAMDDSDELHVLFILRAHRPGDRWSGHVIIMIIHTHTYIYIYIYIYIDLTIYIYIYI
jgi:hypothetical protein